MGFPSCSIAPVDPAISLLLLQSFFFPERRTFWLLNLPVDSPSSAAVYRSKKKKVILKKRGEEKAKVDLFRFRGYKMEEKNDVVF